MVEKNSQPGIIFNEQVGESQLLIDGYGDHGFKVNGKRFKGGLLIWASAFHPLTVETAQQSFEGQIDPLIEAKDSLEFILIGTGPRLVPLPIETKNYVTQYFPAFDLMDTGAAARTYNILVLEGRRVGAILLPTP